MVERVLAVVGLAGVVLVALALTGALQTPRVPGAAASQYCPLDQYGNQYGDCFDDATAPTISSTQSPGANVSGWNRTNVTVTFAATDESGGSGVQSITCTLNGGSPSTVAGSTRSFTFTGTTTITTFVCTAKDFAGNVSGPASRTVKVDKVAPTISLLSRLPAPDPYGWNNTDVTVVWSCSDAFSGVVSSSVTRTITTQGANQTATGTCTDLAGNNSLTNTVFNINIDKTPVVIAPGAPPNDNIVNATVVPSLPFSDASADTTNATHETHEPNCAFPADDKTIWYRFAATQTGFVRVSLSGNLSPPSVPVIGVWSAAQIGLFPVNCASAGVDAFKAQQGVTYFVKVGSRVTGIGPFTVAFDSIPVPPNDAFESPKQIDALPFSESVDLTTATTQPGEPLNPNGVSPPIAESVWYSFTSAQDETVVVGGTTGPTNAVNTNNAVLAVYTGSSLAGLTQVAGSFGLVPVGDSFALLPVIFQAVGGTTYHVQLGAYPVAPGGDNLITFRVERPIVFEGQAPAANANGWNNTDVTLSWHCSSVIPFLFPTTATQTIATEGANQSVPGFCFGPFGSVSDTEGGISIDKTPPSAPTAVADRAPDYAGGGGWFKDVVTVHFTDNGDPDGANGTAGSGVDPGSIPPPVTFDTAGSHTATGTVLDLAGNESAPGNLGVQVDTLAPDLSATFTKADGSAYDPGTFTNQSVIVTFACSDPDGSGVASFSPPATVSTEGAGQSVTGGCVDNVGHSSSQAFGGIDIDKTAPVIASHGNVHVVTHDATVSSVPVTYSLPRATDDHDASVTVICSPESGSSFVVGHTPVTCSATDASGNHAANTTFDVWVELVVSTADLSAYLDSLHLETGLANDLASKVRDAGKKFADGKQQGGCKTLDEFAKRVIGEWGHEHSKLTLAEAKGLLAELYAREAGAGCLTAGSTLPAAEAAVADLIAAIDGIADNGLANDLRSKAVDAGEQAAAGDDNSCKKLAELQRKITAAVPEKLSAGQAATLTTAVNAVKTELGC